MKSSEIIAELFRLCEGKEQEVENAPVMSAAEIVERIHDLDLVPFDLKCDEQFIYSLAKGLKTGAVTLEDVKERADEAA